MYELLLARRRTHVNIVDLIEWGRSNSEEKVQTFRNVAELRVYTRERQDILQHDRITNRRQTT